MAEIESEKYPISIKVDDGYTFRDPDGKVWPRKFKDVYDFSEGLAVVELDDGKYTFVDKNHELWSERFKYVASFQEGLAVVILDDGYTFVDKNHKLWSERFRWVDSFYEGLAVVKLDNGKWTFVNKDHKLWSESFKSILFGFREGLAVVELDNGRCTFVDKNHELWPERFAYACSFQEGLAVVLYNGKYTFVDKNHKLWTERFAYACSFHKGLAVVKLDDGSEKFVNRYRQIFDTEELGRKCGTLIEKPESILEWKTEDFKDEEFIKKCVETIKGSLIEKIEQKNEVDDDYVKYCQELLTGVKDKIEAEKEKIVQEEKNRQETLKLIKDFNL